MQEFKIEPEALKQRRDAKRRLASWGIVLLLFAMSVSIYALGFLGLLSADSDLRWLAWLSVPAILGAGFGAFVLAFREAMRRAEREMIFVLDDNAIVRRRNGFPDVRIAFSDVDTLCEELRWLIVKSTNPVRRIVIPKNINGYDVIRAELTKHHALAAPVKKLPLRSIAEITVFVLSWVAVLSFRDVKVVIPAAVIAMTLFAFGSHRVWMLLYRGPRRRFSLFCIGILWLVAILLIYLHVVRL